MVRVQPGELANLRASADITRLRIREIKPQLGSADDLGAFDENADGVGDRRPLVKGDEEKMDGSRMKQRLLEAQIEQIKEERFPSVAMMNRVEDALQTREQLEAYALVLLEKLESTRFPSLALRNRVDAVADKLDDTE